MSPDWVGTYGLFCGYLVTQAQVQPEIVVSAPKQRPISRNTKYTRWFAIYPMVLLRSYSALDNFLDSEVLI